MNQPKVPSADHGPLSIPLINRAVHNQPSAASPNRTTTSARWARAALNAGRMPTPTLAGADWTPVMGSGGPGEVGLGEPGLPLVLDAEGVDPRPLRLGHRQVRP